jgi:hypothetical protein
VTDLKTPAWIEPMVEARMGLIDEAFHGRVPDAYPLILMPLTEPAEGATTADFDRWERTCDNCGTYCDDSTDFYTGNVTRDYAGVQIIMTFGACSTCAGVTS